MAKQLYNSLVLSVIWGGIVCSTIGEPVKNCPESCQCALSSHVEGLMLTIRNCSSEPGSDLYSLLQEHTDITQLQIISAGLSSLGDISFLTNLELLDLSNNNFTSCEFSKLLKLESLSLSHNNIQIEDCDLSQQEQLNSLYLDNNNLKTFPCKLSKLGLLDLSYNHIKAVDCERTQMMKLGSLHLDHNELKSLPCQLSKLPKITYLGLSNNNIKKLDCDLESNELQYLHLENNGLKSVRCELSKSPRLTVVNLSYNAIQKVGCNMPQLTWLQKVHLEHNKLTTVPCDLLALPPLNYLNLSHNNIQEIDCDLSKHVISKLDTLDLSYNQLTTLPLLRARWCELKVDVSNNEIGQFTNMAGLKHSCNDLPHLNLQNNNITHLMDIFVGWGLAMNEESDFDVCFENFKENFSGNPLDCDCEDYIFYHFLQSTGLTWSNLCYSPVNLNHQNPVSIPLDQFVCQVTEHCPMSCSCVAVPDAQALRVSCKTYTKDVLPKHLPVLESGYTYELDFQRSHLTSLPFISYFLNTTKATFRYSSIANVPKATLEALSKNIRVLNLDNNKLQVLPGEISTIAFKYLVEIHLHGNPWNCNCLLLGFRKFITKYSQIVKDTQLIKCYSPSEVANRKVLDIDINMFCQKETGNNAFIIIFTATTCTVFLAVSVMICILKHRKVKEGMLLNVPQQNDGENGDEIENEGKVFDIFVSYATEDEEYAGVWLIPELEKRGFKVCFHRVHFLGGVPILVNMYECINKSKRMLAFFSENFVDSNYCMHEFDLALSLDIDGGTKKLVTIKEATLDINTLEPSYGSYFRTHTYIEQGAVNFWENLLETMPRNKLGLVAEREGNHDA